VVKLNSDILINFRSKLKNEEQSMS